MQISGNKKHTNSCSGTQDSPIKGRGYVRSQKVGNKITHRLHLLSLTLNWFLDVAKATITISVKSG